MFHNQRASRQSCSLLVVVCGKTAEYDQKPDIKDGKPRYCFPDIVSSGHLEVQLLKTPSTDKFRKVIDSWQPNIVYLQGERLSDDEVGSLVWGGVDLSSGKPFLDFLVPRCQPLSTWSSQMEKNWLKLFMLSSTCHVWDAFQLAHASFRLYCVRNNLVVLEMSQMASGNLGPHLLGDPLKINVPPPEAGPEDGEESNSDSLPAIKIYDDDVNMRFLICGTPCSPVIQSDVP